MATLAALGADCWKGHCHKHGMMVVAVSAAYDSTEVDILHTKTVPKRGEQTKLVGTASMRGVVMELVDVKS
jgi:hypothetical protein